MTQCTRSALARDKLTAQLPPHQLPRHSCDPRPPLQEVQAFDPAAQTNEELLKLLALSKVRAPTCAPTRANARARAAAHPAAAPSSLAPRALRTMCSRGASGSSSRTSTWRWCSRTSPRSPTSSSRSASSPLVRPTAHAGGARAHCLPARLTARAGWARCRLRARRARRHWLRPLALRLEDRPRHLDAETADARAHRHLTTLPVRSTRVGAQCHARSRYPRAQAGSRICEYGWRILQETAVHRTPTRLAGAS